MKAKKSPQIVFRTGVVLDGWWMRDLKISFGYNKKGLLIWVIFPEGISNKFLKAMLGSIDIEPQVPISKKETSR